MDKQYYTILFNYLLVGVCGIVDNIFANNLNIDSLCVFSAFTVITWCTYVLYQFGSYSYRVLLSDSKLCLIIGTIISTIVGITLFIFSKNVAYLYYLTDKQYELLVNCIKIHAIFLPILQLDEFIYQYYLLTDKATSLLKVDIMYYLILILSDIIVVVYRGDLRYLLLCTYLFTLIKVIFLFIKSNIFKLNEKLSIDRVEIILKHGCNMMVDRVCSRLATFIFDIYASKLGTELYAIHGVCYTLGVFTEHFTNTLYSYQMLKLQIIDDTKQKFNECVRYLKSKLIITFIYSYISAYILLIIIHGSLPVIKCAMYASLYCLQVFTVIVYESFRAYLTSERKSEYLRFGGIVGVLIRVPIIIIGYNLNLGLYPFAVSSFIDFGFRGLLYYKYSKNLMKGSDNVCMQ